MLNLEIDCPGSSKGSEQRMHQSECSTRKVFEQELELICTQPLVPEKLAASEGAIFKEIQFTKTTSEGMYVCCCVYPSTDIAVFVSIYQHHLVMYVTIQTMVKSA